MPHIDRGRGKVAIIGDLAKLEKKLRKLSPDMDIVDDMHEAAVVVAADDDVETLQRLRASVIVIIGDASPATACARVLGLGMHELWQDTKGRRVITSGIAAREK